MKPYYQDDLVTLYHGDCLEITEWLTADVLVTDPPYGLGYRPRRILTGTTTAERRERSREMREAGTDRIAADKDTTVRDAALDLWGSTKPGIVFGTWRKPRPANVIQRLLWIKNGGGVNNTGFSQMSWITGDEEIYVIGTTLADFVGTPRRGYYITTEVRQNAVAAVGHPTPKPVSLMEDLIRRSPEGVVADPFAGSGSTLLAARDIGRKSVGVEIEEKYCELIARRLSSTPVSLLGDWEPTKPMETTR